MQGFCFIPCQQESLKHTHTIVWKSVSHCDNCRLLWHIYQCIVSNGLMFYCKYVSLIYAVVRNFIPYFKLKTIEKSSREENLKYKNKNTKPLTNQK